MISVLFLCIFSADISSPAKDRSFYAAELSQAKEAASQGDYARARSLFQMLALRAPYHSYVNYALGRILLLIPRNTTIKKERLLKQKEITLAIQFLQKSVQQDPASGRNLFYLGFAYYFGGYRDLAFHSFQRAVKLDPKFFQSYYNMGVIMEEENNLTASKKFFDLYLKRLKGEKTRDQFDDF